MLPVRLRHQAAAVIGGGELELLSKRPHKNQFPAVTTHLQTNPSELGRRFLELSTFDGLAELLEVRKSQLYYYAFRLDRTRHYKVFEVPKRGGGVRIISAPASPLKIIQRKLNYILHHVYVPKATVQGFVHERNILTNARRHSETGPTKYYVFNLDIKDFFHSISYRRVLGMFMAKPYGLPREVANVLANLCCFEGRLPQGAPTSPIISNMICAKMDSQLRRLAQDNKCIYTRYADDITFSSSLRSFPTSIATRDNVTGQIRAGEVLQRTIEDNGFSINEAKLRLQSKLERQEVTGLTINKFPNVRRRFIRQIRAMLHAWEEYGIDLAQKEFAAKFARSRARKAPPLNRVVRGKLEFLRMIRGEQNPIYIKYSAWLARLDPNFKPRSRSIRPISPLTFVVCTEGKTDWKHLKAALLRFQEQGEYLNLDIEFWEYEDETPMSDKQLLGLCDNRAKSHLEKPYIHIFDRDDPNIVMQVNESNKDYRMWSDDVFSFAIPMPSHKKEMAGVCLEQYYSDADIMRRDRSRRRLFLSTEFDKTSGRHLTENLSTLDMNKVKGKPTIIDDKVYDVTNNNVALPKNDFANYVLNKVPGFDDLDISEFRLIFDLINRIVSKASRNP